MNMIVTAKACATDVLRAVFNPLDGLASGKGGHHSADVAGIDGYLVAKATAKIGRDNAYAMLRQTCDNGKEGAMRVWSLRGEPDGELSRRLVVVRYTTTRLNRCRVNTRDEHILLDDHSIGLCLGKSCIRSCTVARFPVVNLVCCLLILLVGTQERRIGIKSLFGVNKHLQRFVINIDSSYSIGGGIAAGSDDKGDLLHLEMHAVQRQHRFGIGRERGHPGKSCRVEVLAGDDRDHAGYLHGRADIHVLDESVGIGAAHDVPVKHSGQHHVVDIIPLPPNKASVFFALVRLSQAMFEYFSRHYSPPSPAVTGTCSDACILSAAYWMAFTIFT